MAIGIVQRVQFIIGELCRREEGILHSSYSLRCSKMAGINPRIFIFIFYNK